MQRTARRYVVVLASLLASFAPLAVADGGANAVAAGRSPHRLVISSQREGNLDLWGINDDGSEPVRLTSASLDDQQPALSPDGRLIAFARGVAFDSVPPTSDLWIMKADGTDQRPLVADPSAAEYRPSFSPDGTKVLFTRHLGVALQSIWVAPVDLSTSPVLVVDNATYAHWSPNGRIAYVTDPAGDSQIATANPDGSGVRVITTAGGVAPQWSRDGKRIVFTSFRNGRGQIFVINADGTGERMLEPPDTPGTAGFATWSPDGSRIAFSSTRDTSCLEKPVTDCPRRVFTVDATGTESARLLPTDSSLDQYPAYTPPPVPRRGGSRRVLLSVGRGPLHEPVLLPTVSSSRMTPTTSSTTEQLSPGWRRPAQRVALRSTRAGARAGPAS